MIFTPTLCSGWCCGEPQPRPDGNRPGGRHAEQGSRLNNAIVAPPKIHQIIAEKSAKKNTVGIVLSATPEDFSVGIKRARGIEVT